MSRAPWLVAGLVSALGLLASASLLWPASPAAEPFRHAQGDLNEQACGDCHQGSMPLFHSEVFRARDHGQAARVARETCLSCHSEAKSCRACHEQAPPTWHSEALQTPARGRKERDEHVTLAAARSASCAECHARRFQAQCASCHQAQERSAW